MTDIDFTDAIEAGARAWATKCEVEWDGLTPLGKHYARETVAEVVTAAAPSIVAQARARFGRDLYEATRAVKDRPHVWVDPVTLDLAEPMADGAEEWPIHEWLQARINREA